MEPEGRGSPPTGGADRGATIPDPPREYPQWLPSCHAVFFADPDHMKLELVDVPGFAA